MTEHTTPLGVTFGSLAVLGTRSILDIARSAERLGYQSLWTVEATGTDDPPTTSFVSPSDGSDVSGNVKLSATASDDGSVTGVEILDDGAKIGDADFSGGLWSLRWNTKKAAAGDHVLTARATDDGGQTGEGSITVMVDGGGGGGPGGGGGGGKGCNPKKDPDCVK